MRIRGFQWLFAAKLFAAAMLAFAFAVRLGLPQPYWAMVTCCVLMNPLSGPVRSKAVYRVCGTLGAGVLTLALVSVLASVPLLLVIATGLAAVVSFAFSYLDRTPRAYGFQLGAITLMLVAVAGINSPQTMFDTVVHRCTEITLGVMATTLVDSLIAPGSMGPMLQQRLAGWLPDMQRWLEDVFSVAEASTDLAHDRIRSLGDIASLSLIIAQLRYDTTIARHELRYAQAIQQRLLRMAPLLSAARARLAQLSAEQRAQLAPALQEVVSRLQAGEAITQSQQQALRQPLSVDADADAEKGDSSPWLTLIQDQLADVTLTLSRYWSEVQQLQRALSDKSPLNPELEASVRTTRAFPLPPDIDLALRMALSVGVAYSLLCGIWWVTGWSQGAGMVLLGVVALAFFGAGDEPGRAIAMFGRFALLAMTLVGILCYGLLPLATDFPGFMIVMGLFMLPLGVWAAVNPMAILILALGLSSINLQGSYSPWDVGQFLDGVVANLAGIYVAFLCASLFRSWGVSAAVQRYRQQEMRDRLRLLQHATPQRREAYLYRSIDRIAAVSTRLAAAQEIDESLILLRRLRVGANIADLRIALNALGPEMLAPVAQALQRLHLALTDALERQQASEGLQQALDNALSAAWRNFTGLHAHSAQGQYASPEAGQLIRALAGLRLGIFEQAPAWSPQHDR